MLLGFIGVFAVEQAGFSEVRGVLPIISSIWFMLVLVELSDEVKLSSPEIDNVELSSIIFLFVAFSSDSVFIEDKFGEFNISFLFFWIGVLLCCTCNASNLSLHPTQKYLGIFLAAFSVRLSQLLWVHEKHFWHSTM